MEDKVKVGDYVIANLIALPLEVKEIKIVDGEEWGLTFPFGLPCWQSLKDVIKSERSVLAEKVSNSVINEMLS